MFDQVPRPFERECNIQFLFSILFINCQTSLQLNFKSVCTIFVIRKEVSPLPIVNKFYTIEAIFSELPPDFLKIIDFLLARIEFAVIDFFKRHDFHTYNIKIVNRV